MNANERIYRERLLKPVKQYFTSGKQVLDAGCGPGGMSMILAECGCQVYGIDSEDYQLDWQQNNNQSIKFYKQSLELIDFPDASFDAIWIQDTLHHMAYPEKALAELMRVAKPEAPIVVVESNRSNPLGYVRMTLIAGHQSFTRKQFKNKLDLYQKNYDYYMVETRALPINQPVILKLFVKVCDMIERISLLHPWVNYQIGVLSGTGKKINDVIEEHEPIKRRQARVSGEVICR